MTGAQDPEKRLKLAQLAGRTTSQDQPVIAKSEPPKIATTVNRTKSKARKSRKDAEVQTQSLEQIYAQIISLSRAKPCMNDKDARRTIRFSKEAITALDFYAQESMVGISMVLDEAVKDWVKGQRFQERLKSALYNENAD